LATTPVEAPNPSAIEPAGQVAPINNTTAISTIQYPPGQGSEFKLSLANLEAGGGGYFYPTRQDNGFTMSVPPMLTPSSILITCDIIGRLNGSSRIYWSFASGHWGGGGSINFPAGSSQTTYSIQNPVATEDPLKAIWFSVPMGAAIRSCSLEGAFDRGRK
jgi:hypothetical protein